MSKSLDPRIVEYAYVKQVTILPNIESRRFEDVNGLRQEIVTIQTRIDILYELLDADKKFLESKLVSHVIPSNSLMTKQEYLTAIAGSFLGFAAADVEQLSGYVEPSN